MRNSNIFDYNFMNNRHDKLLEYMEQFSERNNIYENMWFLLLFMLNDDDMIQLNCPFNDITDLNPYSHIFKSNNKNTIPLPQFISLSRSVSPSLPLLLTTTPESINNDDHLDYNLDDMDNISINTNIFDHFNEDHYLDGELTPLSSTPSSINSSRISSRSSSPPLSVSQLFNDGMLGIVNGTVSTYSSSSSLSTMGEAKTFEEIKEDENTRENMTDYYSYYIYSYLHPVYSYVKEKTTESNTPEINKLPSIIET